MSFVISLLISPLFYSSLLEECDVAKLTAIISSKQSKVLFPCVNTTSSVTCKITCKDTKQNYQKTYKFYRLHAVCSKENMHTWSFLNEYDWEESEVRCYDIPESDVLCTTNHINDNILDIIHLPYLTNYYTDYFQLYTLSIALKCKNDPLKTVEILCNSGGNLDIDYAINKLYTDDRAYIDCGLICDKSILSGKIALENEIIVSWNSENDLYHDGENVKFICRDDNKAVYSKESQIYKRVGVFKCEKNKWIGGIQVGKNFNEIKTTFCQSFNGCLIGNITNIIAAIGNGANMIAPPDNHTLLKIDETVIYTCKNSSHVFKAIKNNPEANTRLIKCTATNNLKFWLINNTISDFDLAFLVCHQTECDDYSDGIIKLNGKDANYSRRFNSVSGLHQLTTDCGNNKIAKKFKKQSVLAQCYGGEWVVLNNIKTDGIIQNVSDLECIFADKIKCDFEITDFCSGNKMTWPHERMKISYSEWKQIMCDNCDKKYCDRDEKKTGKYYHFDKFEGYSDANSGLILSCANALYFKRSFDCNSDLKTSLKRFETDCKPVRNHSDLAISPIMFVLNKNLRLSRNSCVKNYIEEDCKVKCDNGLKVTNEKFRNLSGDGMFLYLDKKNNSWGLRNHSGGDILFFRSGEIVCEDLNSCDGTSLAEKYQNLFIKMDFNGEVAFNQSETFSDTFGFNLVQ